MNQNNLDMDRLKEKPEKRKKHRKMPGFTAGMIAAVLALGLGLCFVGNSQTAQETAPDPKVTLLAAPAYPQMAAYPSDDSSMDAYDAWFQSVRAQQRDPAYKEGLAPFFSTVMGTFLSEDTGENKVCSPVNIYMALAMLAETSGGDSRQEILNVLGASDLESLRSQAGDLWNAQYHNDQATFLVLANSLWLNQDLPLRQDTINRLAETYCASSYSGLPGSPQMDQALQSWLNDQTGGLLQDQAENVTLDPSAILALASAIRYQAKWGEPFSPELTAPAVFHSPVGEQTADFLRKDLQSNFYWSDHFSAVCLPMTQNAGNLWLVLPDEGISPEALTSDAALLRLLDEPYGWEQEQYMTIHLSLPKFDVASRLDLSSGLQSMGICQVFGDSADFSPLLEPASSLSLRPRLTQCSHAVRVSLDEEGITAAAYTQMSMAGAGAPPREETDFILDRPFLFVLNSRDHLPLFAGVVNQPET